MAMTDTQKKTNVNGFPNSTIVDASPRIHGIFDG